MNTEDEEETKVALTVEHTRLLHYTAGQQAPEPPRRSSPPAEHRSTPGLAFLCEVIETNACRK